ncbi:heme ABC transporter substrate-binding protein IsdE [Paenibacillus agricola]|uniref:High-affinity heme uptake system protein IsdE n=1 Tax=Paenibacillus agricola TaxID=2716264 RepID=A0ABX0J2S2_9BACL|nr:heme ABC transporter substrate-binding protein IsdE [Paenibacillus agricola]NHN29172.1 heme ABC transporter substrate-binding protein IsdE [Paenibacillus agricola]
MRAKWIKIGMLVAVFALLMGCSSVEVAPAAENQGGDRVVTTTVAATQIMDALEMDLVGIPKSVKDLPKRYAGVPLVGNPMSPDMEIVKSLNPTQVLSVTTLEYDLAEVFKNTGIEASFLDLTSVEKMNNAILALGTKYNRQKQADAIVSKYTQKLADINEKAKGKKQPTVLILLGVPGSYLVATELSYIGDLVKIAGGKNIVQGETVEYLASNTEYLQQSNPDIILRAAHGMPEEVIIMFDQEFKKNDIWKHFNAVSNNRVYDLEEELFGTTGNLLVNEALDVLMKMLYPS